MDTASYVDLSLLLGLSKYDCVLRVISPLQNHKAFESVCLIILLVSNRIIYYFVNREFLTETILSNSWGSIKKSPILTEPVEIPEAYHLSGQAIHHMGHYH